MGTLLLAAVCCAVLTGAMLVGDPATVTFVEYPHPLTREVLEFVVHLGAPGVAVDRAGIRICPLGATESSPPHVIAQGL